ncbi:hypothetical protein M2459_002752 [Parabacteroides sp. PF5-5]|uniref:hypothetical protein n=1 Tax=unclassified Parabacteroides TaxID=2649774 RepID=UPI002475AC52|nr:MULTISPECIES: hypothetical protein [unclassified Parabacteroides]MDH6306104.1 hypothetical protein [Parabacteroides sp. PH5-39]MDH6316998.1 hypothetical protein [Parabacteroides sp. PF5-13]MDH6320751.1 hypothetical protein [Parabacteroides sp. PH5-13]MDH6324547.1 hypothetical protein [Parabacteroides sp. PH5-8]MDH6328183.1 hypothetical protein [Parabacteroides sp. PH5-41]
MGNKERIDYLLLDIRELEKIVAGIRDAEVYPVSFFSQTFDLTHKILKDLHTLEGEQVELMRKQMEEYQEMIREIPRPEPLPAPEPEPVPEVIPEPVHAEVMEKTSVSLNDVLEKKNLLDFRKAFSLNDHFYFRRELFSGDEAKMNKVISDLNELHSYEDSIDYLNNKLNWEVDSPIVSEFVKLLEKRFS